VVVTHQIPDNVLRVMLAMRHTGIPGGGENPESH